MFSDQNASDWPNRRPVRESLECSSLSDVEHGLYDGLVSQGMSMKEVLRTPSRQIPLLRNRITCHQKRHTGQSSSLKINIVRILAVEQEGMIRTFAWHIDDQIDMTFE